MSYTVPDFGPSDLLTSSKVGLRRIAVDSQQTSFESNNQFRFHILFSALWGSDLPPIPSSEQLVLKFTTLNPVNILTRTPEVYIGGFVYRVFADDENVTFTGTLSDISDNIFSINGNLIDSGLEAHPESAVSIEYAIGSDIFRSTSKSPNGTVALSDGNSNKSTNTYSPNDLRAGVKGNQTFWLVFDTLANHSVSGMFTISYEERF